MSLQPEVLALPSEVYTRKPQTIRYALPRKFAAICAISHSWLAAISTSVSPAGNLTSCHDSEHANHKKRCFLSRRVSFRVPKSGRYSTFLRINKSIFLCCNVVVCRRLGRYLRRRKVGTAYCKQSLSLVNTPHLLLLSFKAILIQRIGLWVKHSNQASQRRRNRR